MVGTQPPKNSNKWWHLSMKTRKKRLQSGFFYLHFWQGTGENGLNELHLTRRVYRGHVVVKMKHAHVSDSLKEPNQSMFFFPPICSPGTPHPPPLAISLTDSADILWAGDRRVISQGETGLSSASEYAAPSACEQTDTHDTFRHSLPDNALACRQNQRGHLSHAIRLENKDDEVWCTKGSWGIRKL